MIKLKASLSRCLFFSSFAVGALFAQSAEVSRGDEAEIERVASFAKAYGYVRFFHPSDQAAQIDWIAMAVDGVHQARQATQPTDKEWLRQIFEPVAPKVDFASSERDFTVSLPRNGQRTYWQHFGAGLYKIFLSRRVLTGTTSRERAPLFDGDPGEDAEVRKEIGQGTWIRVPLTLPVDAIEATAPRATPEFEALKTRLTTVDTSVKSIADADARIAGVVIVWNVIQHFSPYIEDAEGRWETALRPAIREAIEASSDVLYTQTLLRLLANLRDGHGILLGIRPKFGGLPIRAQVVDDQIVVTGSAEGCPLKVGDIIEKIDGKTALEALADLQAYTPGSPQLSKTRALNRLGAGPIGSKAKVAVRRAGDDRQALEIERQEDKRNLYQNGIPEFTFPAFTEVSPGIYYVNIWMIEADDFAAKLPVLAKAKGIIFDHRSSGSSHAAKSLEPHKDIIPHLIDLAVEYAPMSMPLVIRPDHEDFRFSPPSVQKVEPASPRFEGKIVFINTPAVVSYGETYMALVAQYKLGQMVGEPTAGCNGAANSIPVPGGFQVGFTQMNVVKHDHSPLYQVGYAPDVPATRSLSGIREGRDEVLETAVRAIR